MENNVCIPIEEYRELVQAKSSLERLERLLSWKLGRYENLQYAELLMVQAVFGAGEIKEVEKP